MAKTWRKDIKVSLQCTQGQPPEKLRVCPVKTQGLIPKKKLRVRPKNSGSRAQNSGF